MRLSDYGKRFEDWMVKVFYNYGLFLAKHQFWFLVGPLICTVLSIPGLFFLQINLDLYRLFVPTDAPVRYEFERTKDFNRLPLGDLNLIPKRNRREFDCSDASCYFPDVEMDRLRRDLEAMEDEARHDVPFGNVTSLSRYRRDTNKDKEKKDREGKLVPAKNDILRFYVVHRKYDNLLQSKYLGALFQYTQDMMKVTNDYEGETWGLEDFCTKDPGASTCNNNLNLWIKHADVLFKDGKIKANPNLQLSYPVLYLFNRPKDIGNVIYGVDVKGEKNEIQGARVLTIHWFVNYPATPENNAAYYAFRQKLNKYWESIAENSDLQFIPHNDKAMDDEMLEIIKTTVPYAFPATILLTIYVLVANFSWDRTKSKPVEMCLGVWCVIFALIITFGVFFFCGAKFNPVTSTMPFLVLAVGVDDDFLMVAAWRECDRKLSPATRIALVMGDAGASITVTSFTNFFCFFLGWLMCSTPAVADFCIITAVGVFFDYLMQITFYAAVLKYSGDREDKGGLACCTGCYTKIDEDDDDVERNCAKTEAAKEKEEHIDFQHHEKTKDLPLMHRLFRDYFAPFIMNKWVRIGSLALFPIYTAFALYGCSILRVDISPVKYIRDNSPIQTFVALADKYIWADNVMPTFHIMNPPDLRDAGARARLNELVFRLEHTSYSIGRVSTNLWIWQYQQYLNDFPNINYTTDFYDRKNMRDFFSQLDYSQYRDKVKILDNVTNGEPCISAFSFQTSFYGLDSWDKRQSELFLWRDILKEYPDFDMFLSGIFSPFLIDQRHTIAPSSMQTIGSALAMMALISFFFLPDALSVFWMTWSLLSISMGVCGGLALLGSDLDSVSMGCIVMAIGLAVDYSVHICYRYHRSEYSTAQEKVADTLASVGWPITQAVSSTLVGLAITILVPAYLVRVFFQTVYLVNIIGLFHALIWLPQLISALDPVERVPLRERHVISKQIPHTLH
ncbi:hypothetical protein L5515_017960 [Caenorhabditis briggsae]|uniref:SSD domain-containing protein n=2 Tax=Caenorhabditis briggsae TaxID=6238 RepID=A0AAE9FB11_CAEBR|nr:hypothetical protein L5515_017960 [Caenorhabditis briggsae]